MRRMPSRAGRAVDSMVFDKNFYMRGGGEESSPNKDKTSVPLDFRAGIQITESE
jgi:hypothetical protein